MVTASDLVQGDARRLGVGTGDDRVRIPNVSAPIDDGDALGRAERQGSNEFPDGTTDGRMSRKRSGIDGMRTPDENT